MFARVAIPAGIRILDYRGALISYAQADRDYGDGAETGHTFLFTLNERYIVDGNVGGNAARWINHSCAPNCEASIVEHAGGDRRRDRIVISAVRDIAAGEELSYNYGIVLEIRHTPRMKRLWACHCGAPDCSGTLLQPKQPSRVR